MATNISLNRTIRISFVFAQLLLLKSSQNPDPKPTDFSLFATPKITKNGRNGNIRETESVVYRMPTKNIISWTAMLAAYADNGKINRAREVFDEMPERSFASWNAMITAYIPNVSGIEEAVEFFRLIPERNVVSYAAIITGFVKDGMLEKTEELYAETPVIWRDPVCSNTLISGHLKMGDLKEVVRVFEGVVEKDVVSWRSMVDGYCKEGRIGEARYLFDRIPESNVVSWTAMINGYLKTGISKMGWDSSWRRCKKMVQELILLH